MDDNALNKLIHSGIIFSFYRSLTALPPLPGKTFAWVQLLLVDEQQTAQLKLHALGSLVASPDDDLDFVDRSREEVVEHSRKLFKDAAPYLMNDFGLWIFSRSMIFLFFAVDGDIPGDLCNREALLDFLRSLNSGDGIRKIHAFTVVAGCVDATRKKLRELRGRHLTA